MLKTMGLVGFFLLTLGVPFVVTLFAMALILALIFFPDLDLSLLVGQVVSGIKPASLVCIPMFVLAGNIITSGQSAKRLVSMIRAWVGHVHGGMPIVTNIACTLFGAVSGSTCATVAAIGGTMRPMLLEAGYSSSFSLGLIINSSDIAWMIPPSIGFIVYGVANKVSVGKLFIAGILPGILIAFLFSVFCYIYSRYYKIGLYPKASWKERIRTFREAILLFGFPVLILGGIYRGIFSVTEAAAFAVLYAVLLEGLVYKSITLKKVIEVCMSTAMISGRTLILVGGGQVLSWLLSYSGIYKEIMPYFFGTDPSFLRVIAVISIVYFIACMFVDPIVVIFVLSPLFAPYIASSGVDKILVGVLVVLFGAIGTATPPYGCDIFYAMVIFKRPYLEVIRMTWPFVIILVLSAVIIIAFPGIATYLPRLAAL